MKRFIMIIIIISLVTTFNNKSFGENLNVSGQSYILIDEVSGRVLLEKNSNEKMPMASTTKIMTSLIAIEKGNLEDLVLIDEKSINIEGSSIYLKKDELIPLKDLVYGLMLRSGNDAALAIANHIGQSYEDFILLMNNRAKALGAYNTNFANPHGLTEKDHYSTAYDLALITREAFKYKEFEEISKAKTYNSIRAVDNYFVNKNKTLWEYSGGDGVKIGYTMNSGRCLVSSAKRNDMRLIAVSLNAPNWFNDNYRLFDYGFENFKPYIIFDNNQFLLNLDIEDGMKDQVPLVTKDGFIYPLKIEEKDKLKINIIKEENISAPINKGEVLGRVDVYLDNVLIKKIDLIAKDQIKKKNLWNKIKDKLKFNNI